MGGRIHVSILSSKKTPYEGRKSSSFPKKRHTVSKSRGGGGQEPWVSLGDSAFNKKRKNYHGWGRGNIDYKACAGGRAWSLYRHLGEGGTILKKSSALKKGPGGRAVAYLPGKKGRLTPTGYVFFPKINDRRGRGKGGLSLGGRKTAFKP